MARQVIDTSPPIGDPAPTAFGKVNAMTAELYPLATGALQKTGGRVSGELLVGGAGGWRMVADGADVYMDARANVTSSTVPDGSAVYRGATHRWTNSNGVDIGTLSGTGTLNITSTISAQFVDALGATASLRFVDRTDFTRKWAWYSTGAVARLFYDGIGDRLNVSYTGAVGAVSFNPTSSADVKDNLEGYKGDACAELDRLVVITYNYRPEFGGPEGKIAGLLAENVQTVYPNAVGGDYDEKVLVPSEELDGDGNPMMVEQTRHVPMNIDMMQILATSIRSHQQKSRRIKQLEVAVEDLLRRMGELEVGR